MKLRGRHVVLRAWRSGDAPRVAEACNDPLIARWIPLVPSPYELADAEAYIADCLAAPADRRQAFAVTDADDDVLGSIDVRTNVFGTGHIGYWIAAWGRGRGVCTDALTTLSRWCLDEGGLGRVELMVDPGNPASARVAEKAGYTREAVLRSAIAYRDGSRADAVMYSLLPGETD